MNQLSRLHGPSGLDTDEWRRLTAFGQRTKLNTCKAKPAVRIATQNLVEHLGAYNNCHFIPLDKYSGVGPIGIGEVLKRLVGKSIIHCLKSNLTILGSSKKLCLGQKCGIKHAIPALRAKYNKETTNAILKDAATHSTT